MSEITKLYENANIKPEYRYDCNLADTIKPVEVFSLRSCSKGEIKDYCTNKQDYKYCKVYKVNKIYPPFTAEKQIELIKWLIRNHKYFIFVVDVSNFEETLAKFINELAKDNWLTLEEKQQVKEILE